MLVPWQPAQFTAYEQWFWTSPLLSGTARQQAELPVVSMVLKKVKANYL